MVTLIFVEFNQNDFLKNYHLAWFLISRGFQFVTVKLLEHVILLNIGSDGFYKISLWQVSSSGWSEGETRGRAGWFPSSYVEKRQRIPANKVADVGLNV